MTISPDEVHESGSRCWCCGQVYVDDDLIRLGSRPEAAVCFRCARFLHQRARQAQDENSTSPGARARQVVDHSREFVVEQGWQRLPVVGPVLRWLGDHVP